MNVRVGLWRKLSAEEMMLLWCWRRILRVLWTARRSNWSILKEISPEYSLEGLMLKLKLQYFGYLVWRTVSLEKTQMLERLKAGGGGDDRGWDGWMASPTQWTRVWANSRNWWWIGKPGVLQSMGSQSQTWLSDRTELRVWTYLEIFFHNISSQRSMLFHQGIIIYLLTIVNICYADSLTKNTM